MAIDPLVGFRDDDNRSGKSRGTGAARVYGALREEILCLRLAPASPLDEVGLSARFGLSRSPVREALIRLAGEGLVVVLPNRSTIVAPMELESLPDYLDALDMLQRLTHRLAALRRGPDDIKAIKAAQAAFDKAVDRALKKWDSLPVIDRNHDFHMAIARAGRNPYFTSFYKRLLDEGRRMLHLHFMYHHERPDFSKAEFAGEHDALVQTIEAGDGEAAEALAHSHTEQFRGQFLQYLSQSLTRDVSIDDLDDRRLVSDER